LKEIQKINTPHERASLVLKKENNLLSAIKNNIDKILKNSVDVLSTLNCLDILLKKKIICKCRRKKKLPFIIKIRAVSINQYRYIQ